MSSESAVGPVGTSPSERPNRRVFLGRTGGALAGLGLGTALSSRVFAGEDNTIKIVLVGCGGRGTGAALNALSTAGPTQLWAVADVFPDRVSATLANLTKKVGKKAEVPAERQFLGFDAYRKAIDSLEGNGVALLVTPAAFRPLHLDYAVEKGCHVFMEKSFAIDAPGVRRVLAAGETATKKNLKIAGGLMSRHHVPLIDAVKQIHGGAIGDIVACWVYRQHGPAKYTPKAPGMTEMAHQIRNQFCFTWISGGFFTDWMIHNLDAACWIKNAWPVSAQGQGGRQARQEPDQMFDHYAVEYTFPDGTQMMAQGRHMAGCWPFFGDIIHGTKGSALLGEGALDPKIYKGYQRTTPNRIWRYRGPKPVRHYQLEHDLLFDAIRNDKPYNETQRCAMASMTSILGRMAAESGQKIEWDKALASKLEVTPGLEKLALDGDPPVLPDADGRYPLPVPGMTKTY